ncbi:MAG TPA: DUF721 domain-containing protein [Verrucomicrobiota bacterium]|nr:DUF721 domain-containing protein [Verrucomicrobiota bacterium]
MARRKNKSEEQVNQARLQALAEWRGIDLSEEERARTKSEKSAADIVKNALEHIKFEERRKNAEILNVWRNAIDPVIVEHTEPATLKNGTLIVNVDSSVWLSEIARFKKREILVKLQSCFGKEVIKNIKFRLG